MASKVTLFKNDPILRRIVGQQHVGQSDESVIAAVIERMKKGAFDKLSTSDQKAFREAVVKVHRENQKMYRDVMGGHFGNAEADGSKSKVRFRIYIGPNTDSAKTAHWAERLRRAGLDVDPYTGIEHIYINHVGPVDEARREILQVARKVGLYVHIIDHIKGWKSLKGLGGEQKWRKVPDGSEFKNDPVASRLYGEWVFYLLHNDGSAEQKAMIDEMQARLTKMQFTGWGLQVDQWPLAREAYLRLCKKFGVEPEATRGVKLGGLGDAKRYGWRG